MGILRYGRKVLLILLVFLLLGWEGKAESSLVFAAEIGQETSGNNENPIGTGTEANVDETDSWDPEEDETDRSTSSEKEQESDTDRGKKSGKKQKTSGKSWGKRRIRIKPVEKNRRLSKRQIKTVKRSLLGNLGNHR